MDLITADIRLIAFDLDGTLLNAAKILTTRNKHALERAADKGIPFPFSAMQSRSTAPQARSGTERVPAAAGRLCSEDPAVCNGSFAPHSSFERIASPLYRFCGIIFRRPQRGDQPQRCQQGRRAHRSRLTAGPYAQPGDVIRRRPQRHQHDPRSRHWRRHAKCRGGSQVSCRSDHRKL